MDPSQPPGVTNPAGFFAATDLGGVYPHTHCVRLDSLSGAIPGVNLSLKIAKWLTDLLRG